jgi:hypothetical protein
LQTGVYGAKINAKRNQTQIKQQAQWNKENKSLWYAKKQKPI